MKKIIAMLLAVVMCLGLLVSCGGENSGDASSAGTQVNDTGKTINTDVNMASIGEESVKKDVSVPAGSAHVISLTLDKNVLPVAIGTTGKISYTVKPETAYDSSVYFVSANPDIAKVDKDGNVLAVACGSTTIDVITNDQGFKRTVQVVVHQNEGNEAKSKEMIDLINKARVANEQSELKSESAALNAAANQRAFEEAVDVVNNKEKVMNDTRTGKQTTIFADYGIWVRASAACYVWGDYSNDTQKAYDALVESDANKAALGISGTEKVDYDNIAVGYFVFNDVTYWCVLLASN